MVRTGARRGLMFVLSSPSGAGKTTLIGQISGSLPSDAGSIRFDGRDVTALPMHARVRAGLTRSFQITEVLPAFTARENVAVALQARAGHSFRFWKPVADDVDLNARADACLADLGLGSRADTRAGTLSHGEKRALELAIAIACAPKLLLLDEPMAGTGREETQRLIDVLRCLKTRYAMLLVEHDMSAVFALADRISVLVYGEIVATGTPAEIREDPRVREAYLGEEAAV